jgi:dTDP-4-dehydrorhamnose reductase
MRVLITGARGLLAAAVTREFAAAGDVIALDRSQLDITNPGDVARALADRKPAVVINCAAYNDVDGAEENAEGALRVNAIAVLGLSRAAREAGAGFVHYSTDFVFAGDATHPYGEDDLPNPRGVYAASKLVGEWLALEHPGGYVLRVESLFGPAGPGTTRQGSLAAIVARIRAREPVPVFVDRTVSPSYTTDVARATRELLARRTAPGLYHCVNSGAATWAEIAEDAARVLNVPLFMTPITLESVALKAPRPKYSALSNAKLHAAGVVMPPWQDALARYLKAGC